MIPERARLRLIALGQACLAARSTPEHALRLVDLDQHIRFLRRTLSTLKPDAEADNGTPFCYYHWDRPAR